VDDLSRLAPDLASLGWDATLDQWAGDRADTHRRGRVARADRGWSVVFTGGEAVLAASGSIRADVGVAPATGDFVLVHDDAEDGPVLADIAPRRTELARRAAGRQPEPQVLAANCDDVLVMHGLDRPFNPRRLERQLVVAWASRATPVIVLTKADLVASPDAEVAAVRRAAPGVEVLAVSTITGHGLGRVAERATGVAGDGLGRPRTLALLGLSGIGKSTLVNALSGGEVQRIGEVRAADQKGRHTTVSRDLIPLPHGGIIIDTPGVREIGLWQAHAGVDQTFAEITETATGCRFSDCEHLEEPGCEVRPAVADGRIRGERLEHWRALHAELELQDEQLEEFARRAESRDRASAQRRARGERPPKPSRSRATRRRRR
jgi:ribosome biogenesis GTPase / thiamine phosphate phosphatase